MKFAPKFLTVFLIVIASICHAGVTLRFQEHITPGAHRFGDLLLIEDDKAHWSDLSLSSHPAAGELITKDKVLDWMTQRLGKFAATWHGKTQIRVQQITQTSGKALQDKAKSELLRKLGSKYSRIEVEAITSLNDSEYALDTFKAKTTIAFPVAKRVCVLLNNDKQHIPVWFRVRAYAQVLVSAHHLKYNTLIQKDAFSWKERNIAGLKSPPALFLPENSWLAASLEANHILLSSHIKEAPLIVHGQTVKVHFTNNRISLVMDAIALSDGTIGQTIRVKNKRNQKMLVVRVTGLQQAEVIA